MKRALSIAGCLLLGVATGCRKKAPRLPPPPLRVMSSIAPIVLNGMRSNGFPFGRLGAAALDAKALSANAALAKYFTGNGGAQTALRYMVECALRRDQTVAMKLGNTTLSLKGAAGLAPEWAKGPCKEACQEWVSACILARTNTYQLPVILWTTSTNESGPQDDLTAAAARGFTVEEGAFFGNFFTEPARQYACTGSGFDPVYSTFRVCTQPGHLCGIQVVGPCGDFDGRRGRATTRRACASRDAKSGYARCHSQLSGPGGATFPRGAKTYTRVITTLVRQSSLLAPSAKRCGGAAPRVPDAGVGDAAPSSDASDNPGARCVRDADCRGTDMFCDLSSVTTGVCTKGCKDDTSQAAEQRQCGGASSTCLSVGTQNPAASYAFCTNVCTPGQTSVAKGGCPPYRICTGLWIYNTNPDSPGCFPFCSHDSHCPPTFKCNPRTGACGLGFDGKAKADGEPCNPSAAATGTNRCRGVCILFHATDGTKGICASFIRTTAFPVRCPDLPNHVSPIVGRTADDLGICYRKRCNDDRAAPKPLRCRPSTGGGSLCQY